ncbi:hypothetical protein ACQPZJ_01570 [Actinoplanes sp. CA-054009]
MTTALAPTVAHSRSAARRMSSQWADVAAIAVFLVLGLIVMGGYLPDPGGTISGHLADDNTWFEWLLSHGAYCLRHLENPLFSTRQNAPVGVNMMANTSVLGVTLPLAPLTMLLGPKIVYVVWIVGACAATATTTYWVLSRHLVSSRAAAFAGGALAGFAPGVIHHANGQPNFVSNFLLPLIVLRVLRLGAEGRMVRQGLTLGLLITWQIFINEELLLVTAVACAAAVVTRAVLRPGEARSRLRPFAVSLAVAGGVVAVLCAYPLWLQFLGPQHYRGIPAFHSWGEDIAAYVTMPRDTVGGLDSAETTVGRIEQNTWFGWPLAGVGIVLAIRLRRDPVARIAAVTAFVCAVGSLGPHIRLNGEVTAVPGPWLVIPDRTPVLGMMTPTRLSYGVIGALVVLVALGWDSFRRDKVVPAIIAAALLPLTPTPVPAVRDQQPPDFIVSGAWRPYVPAGHTLVPVPLPDNGPGRGTLAWSAQQRLEFPVPRGYFLGPDARGDAHMGSADRSLTAELAVATIKSGQPPIIGEQDRATVLAELREWHASVVVLGPQPAEEPLRMMLTELFGPGRRDRDVWVWQPLTGSTADVP